MARMTIAGDTAKVTDALLGGSPVPALRAWFDFAKGQKNVIATTNDGISAIEVNSDDVSIAPVLLALSEGFTVEGAPICIKMTPAQYAGDVPEGISNRVKEDGTVRKWNEWHAPVTHDHKNSGANDGDKLVFGSSWGFELTSAELLTLLAGGYTLIMAHEAPQYYPAVEV